MNISMNAEIVYLAISIIVTILVTTITTILTIKKGNESTQKILDRIAHAIHSIAHLTEKVASHSEVEFELGGVKIAENITSKEEAEKLGEVVKYNPKLKLCYYRPKKSAT